MYHRYEVDHPYCGWTKSRTKWQIVHPMAFHHFNCCRILSTNSTRSAVLWLRLPAAPRKRKYGDCPNGSMGDTSPREGSHGASNRKPALSQKILWFKGLVTRWRSEDKKANTLFLVVVALGPTSSKNRRKRKRSTRYNWPRSIGFGSSQEGIVRNESRRVISFSHRIGPD